MDWNDRSLSIDMGLDPEEWQLINLINGYSEIWEIPMDITRSIDSYIENMNSFFLDLICYKSLSKQKLYKQQTEINHKKLLNLLFKWNIIPYILKQCHLYANNDNVNYQFLTFFIDLVARSASIQKCKILFPDKYSLLIVNELIGNGLLCNDNQKRLIWTVYIKYLYNF